MKKYSIQDFVMKQTCTATSSSCASLLKALADAHRWSVVDLLLDNPMTVADLLGKLGLEQSLLSHHLKILRQAGIVESRREGKMVRYRLSEAVSWIGPGRGLDLGCCRLEMKRAPEARTTKGAVADLRAMQRPFKD
jgi:ArsR family transcriptional regulator, nickel/cobalt-responsive transcriptional repressor